MLNTYRKKNKNQKIMKNKQREKLRALTILKTLND